MIPAGLAASVRQAAELDAMALRLQVTMGVTPSEARKRLDAYLQECSEKGETP